MCPCFALGVVPNTPKTSARFSLTAGVRTEVAWLSCLQMETRDASGLPTGPAAGGWLASTEESGPKHDSNPHLLLPLVK